MFVKMSDCGGDGGGVSDFDVIYCVLFFGLFL